MIKLFSRLSIAIFVFLTSINTHANLLISPLRVVLDSQQRSSTVTLINSGSDTRSYRISWSQKVSLPQGGYRDLTEDEQKVYSGLERIVRISPKQVTLSPGQRQSVKLLLRDPGTLAKGEYRSHLTFTALPVHQSDSEQSNSGQTGIKINVLMGYTMPVIYRTGTVSVSPEIDNLSLVTIKETGATFIKVKLSHDDMFSSSGRLVAYWAPTGGQAKEVGLINGFNFYPENKTAEVKVPWNNFTLEPGRLEVRYEGQQEFSGLLLARKTLEITPAMVQSVQ